MNLWKLVSILAAISLFHAQAALACDEAPDAVTSPDGKIKIEFCVAKGIPNYAVHVEGKKALGWSALGFTLKDAPPLTAQFRVRDRKQRTFDETWEQVWGEERFIRNHYNELKVNLAQNDALKRELNVIFRAFNDGIGFRYEFPEQPNLKQFVIMDERTEFNFERDHQAWWIPAMWDNRYEYLFKKTPFSKMLPAHTPLTIEAGELTFSIHEAALVDYASMAVQHLGGGRLSTVLIPWSDGTKVVGNTPLVTPWRTIQIGKTPGDLATSYLILNLNEPNKIQDTSWIKPMKYIGVWWGMHLDRFTWGSGPKHGATTERTKQYIDYAAQFGIPGVLVEGWNIGWDGNWYENGNVFDFTQPYPDFDLPWLAKYARERGVELIGHHETAAAISNYERQMDAAFKLYSDLGVRTVKTGYVGSRAEKKEWHHGQFMVRHHQRVIETAAQYRIMINAHEPIKDTGLRRTYPNFLTREGARGAEYDAWGGSDGNPPEHTTIVPFTRGLAGPFDYTPGIFDLLTGKTPADRVRTTLAKQLAFYVVIYSPLHMAADLPENYVGHPAFKFIQDVPTDWETTRVLSSQIGDHATFARKDRNSDDWYLGSITDENAREFNFKLDFLSEGRSYCAEIYSDQSDSHYLKNPKGYQITKKTVQRGDDLHVKLAAGGGQAIRFAAAGACSGQ